MTLGSELGFETGIGIGFWDKGRGQHSGQGSGLGSGSGFRTGVGVRFWGRDWVSCLGSGSSFGTIGVGFQNGCRGRVSRLREGQVSGWGSDFET
ncbi:hypothetical protein TIFTF001_053747 [Ficus carica]|uniref:Uncharacterized protein n=1 Tax=Ficus carica TaxID=3494 RepID=A0AA88EF84_FICCA|nr:hypothetical protein TIFTF001_053747 [Ficus carica]